MKNMQPLVFISILCALAFTAIRSHGQTNYPISLTGDIELKKDTVARWNSIKGKSVDGKVYFKWNVRGQHVDGTYLIYRSQDGTNFCVAGSKKGTGVPVNLDIAYYFVDDFPNAGPLWYKVVHIGADLTFMASECISVPGSPKNILTATK